VIEHNIVSVSGGKDSTAMLLLAVERQPDNLSAVFADTGNEHSQTYEYIHYLSDKVLPIRWVKADFSEQIARRREMMQRVIDGTHVNRGRYEWTPDVARRALEYLHPTGIPFLDACFAHGMFPCDYRRFCTDELKRKVIASQVNQPIWDTGDAVISWQGIRADESAPRAAMKEEEDVNQQYTIYRPLLHWTAEQCFKMHEKHGIKPNPLYKQGMQPTRCMPCIYSRKDELLEIGKRFPEEIERIAQWEQLVRMVSKTGAASFFQAKRLGAHSATEVTKEDHGILAQIEWAKTARGGRQFDMFRMADDGPVCSSAYGLCE
jgi:3'-phosphoadenosine 5'-phosphosulfate sulfotransferase (PAPS reductase)/FAD synthetase